MQRINLTYTQFFNKKYSTVGHIFQGRYKSFLCDRDEYLLSLVRYIHANPVRAKLVEHPREYKWSSHRDYLSGCKGLVDAPRVLQMFSKELSQARRQYREFVKEGQDGGKDESLYKGMKQQILGGKGFVAEVEKKVIRVGTSLKRPSLQEVLKAVSEVTGISEEDMESRRRGREVILARGVLASAWREFGNRLGDLQPKIKRDLSVLSRLSRISNQGEGKRMVGEVLKKLNARMQA